MTWLCDYVAPKGRLARPVSVLIVVSSCLLFLMAGPSAQAQEAAAGATMPVFVLGVGDQLTVFNYAENSREECLIRPDGKISLPLVGEILAAGKDPSSLERVIEAALAKFQEAPDVTVMVRQIHSYRIYLLGRVNTQRMLESVVPLTLLQAISMAGGLNEFASERVVIHRSGKDGQKLIEVDYGKILKGREPGKNILLRAGDIVVAQ